MRSPVCKLEPGQRRFSKWLIPIAALAVAVAVVVVASLATKSDRVAAQKPGVVKIEVTDEGFSPSSVTLSPGAPVELEFLRTTDETCAHSVAFPELGIREPLALNKPVLVKVPASQRRSLVFQCGVGDHRSAVVIN